MPASYAAHRAQLQSLLQAWGMKEAFAVRTAEVMAWSDLHGIDSHGISMVPAYYERHLSGRVNMRAEPSMSRQTPVSALVDGGGGLGHEPSRQAMEAAIERAQAIATQVSFAIEQPPAHLFTRVCLRLDPPQQRRQRPEKPLEPAFG